MRYQVFKVNYKIIIHRKDFYKIFLKISQLFLYAKCCRTKYGHFVIKIINILQASFLFFIVKHKTVFHFKYFMQTDIYKISKIFL